MEDLGTSFALAQEGSWSVIERPECGAEFAGPDYALRVYHEDREVMIGWDGTITARKREDAEATTGTAA